MWGEVVIDDGYAMDEPVPKEIKAIRNNQRNRPRERERERKSGEGEEGEEGGEEEEAELKIEHECTSRICFISVDTEEDGDPHRWKHGSSTRAASAFE